MVIASDTSEIHERKDLDSLPKDALAMLVTCVLEVQYLRNSMAFVDRLWYQTRCEMEDMFGASPKKPGETLMSMRSKANNDSHSLHKPMFKPIFKYVGKAHETPAGAGRHPREKKEKERREGYRNALRTIRLGRRDLDTKQRKDTSHAVDPLWLPDPPLYFDSLLVRFPKPRFTAPNPRLKEESNARAADNADGRVKQLAGERVHRNDEGYAGDSARREMRSREGKEKEMEQKVEEDRRAKKKIRSTHLQSWSTFEPALILEVSSSILRGAHILVQWQSNEGNVSLQNHEGLTMASQGHTKQVWRKSGGIP
ncbi:hypothetical protein BKA70DRAFT_1238315 [Coprinopsis sp. MPI-PUGE-AT-0042]|nr:hypothetical protein BKA70DRAFT_1238315 [Coprinopsis sp. MPI-PUGE-AT-0042]